MAGLRRLPGSSNQENPSCTICHQKHTNLDEYALPLRRKAIVVVGSEGSVPDCNLSAIEREFPWVTVERAVTIERACGHFDHPCQLVLIDELGDRPGRPRGRELAGRHPERWSP